jgi:hypothetical protein
MTSLTNWFRGLRSDQVQGEPVLSTKPRRQTPHKRLAPRLSIECLEDRSVPAALNVSTTLDGVAGSLRAAIIAANATPGENTIVLPAGNYALTLAGANEDLAATGDLDITNHLKIVGAGADATIIDGGYLDRVFHLMNGKHVTISGVTVQRGFADCGGGIYSQSSTLTIDHCTITGNGAFSSGGGVSATDSIVTIKDSLFVGNHVLYDGGGIAVTGGALTIDRSAISNNFAYRHSGGGIYSNNASVAIRQSTIDTNWVDNQGDFVSAYGGGIAATCGALTIDQSTISRNFTNGGNDLGGGGIYVGGGAALAITHSTISGNVNGNYSGGGGGGIYVDVNGALIVVECILSGNSALRGGGIFVGLGGLSTLSQSTISGNSAVWGGGIFVENGTSTIAQCTIFDNRAFYDGGGIFVDRSTLAVVHSNITGNAAGASGGGIFADRSTLTIAQSTISANTSSSGGGLYAFFATAEIDHSTLNDLIGGGIFNDHSLIHLKHTVEDGVLYKNQYFV